MKKILLTSVAMALVGGAASAQSVLERVLAQTDALGQVTGVFANVADNIGTPGTTTVYVATAANAAAGIAIGDILTADQFASLATEEDYTVVPTGAYVNLLTNEVISAADYAALPANQQSAWTVTTAASHYVSTNGTIITGTAFTALPSTADFGTQEVAVGGLASIDGSITNIVSGLDEVQASVMGTVTAVDVPTVNFGNMATTVLGAVNTGEIGLGTNQVVEEALAGTTQAIRSEIQQIGTLSGLTQVALNSALNTMSINGSISNSLSGVNGSVAAISPDVLEIAMSASDTLSLTGVADLLGSMNTTVLGAVNTGTIVSGVNNQVDGTVAGIVGNSATNMFGATE